MKGKRVAIIITIFLMMILTIISSNVNADSFVTFSGKVKPFRTTGTVEAKCGPDGGSAQIINGKYSISFPIKFQGYSANITAYTNRGTMSKIVEKVYGGEYIIDFDFGGSFYFYNEYNRIMEIIRNLINNFSGSSLIMELIKNLLMPNNT